jgi:hypothetical protein
MRGQHRLQRFRFHRGQIDQDAVRRQRWQLSNRCRRDMNRHADDNHTGIGDNLFRPRPVVFFKDTNLISGKRQHFLKQTPHLPAAANNHDRTQVRIKRFKTFIVFAGIRLPHDATQNIFDKIRRDPKRSSLLAPGRQHRRFTFRDVNRQAILAFNLSDFRYQLQALSQQFQQRLIDFINLIA